MKKTITLFIVFFVGFALNYINGNAQTILPSGELQYKAWGNIANSNGNKLTEDELRGILDSKLYTDYTDARSNFVKGRTLCLIGIPTAAYGMFLVYSPKTMLKFMSIFDKEIDIDSPGSQLGTIIAGCMVLTASGVLLGIGIPKFFVGRHQIKNVVDDYNQQKGYTYSPSISFGAQTHGIGFAVNF